MGVLIRWRVPSSYSTWYTVQIHISDDGGSTFAQIASQAVTDNTYYDVAGDTTNFYKVRFVDDDTGSVSDFSDSIQGGEVNAYCSIEDIRVMTGLTTSEISDADVFHLLEFATAHLNSEINYEIKEERVRFIDNEKKNEIDGSNTTFYVRKPWIGDMNNDGQITTADVQVWKLDSQSNRTDLTVSSIDDDQIGKFTLSTAPSSGDRVFVRYYNAPLDEETPHALVKMACALLTGAWAFTKIEAKRIKSFRLGKAAVSRQSEGFDEMMRRYQRIVNDINQGMADTIELQQEVKSIAEVLGERHF